MSDFVDLYYLLKKSKIKFFLTGGYALFMKGVRNYYNDIDFCVKKEDLTKVARILKTQIIKKQQDGLDIAFNVVKHKEFEFSTYENFRNTHGQRISFGFNTDVTKHLDHVWDSELVLPIISMEHLLVLKILMYEYSKNDYDLQDCKEILTHRKINFFLVYRISQQRSLTDLIANFLIDNSRFIPSTLLEIFKN